jgi:hypothetical protein
MPISPLNQAVRVALYVKDCKETIARHGWMVQGVFADETQPGFAYTVGLTAEARSELLIAGLPHDIAATLLNTAAEQHKREAFQVGGTVTGVASIDFRVVDAPHAEIGMARRVYGDAVTPTCLQLVWPDKDGNYPGDPGWKSGAVAQPIYDTEGGRNA